MLLPWAGTLLIRWEGTLRAELGRIRALSLPCVGIGNPADLAE